MPKLKGYKDLINELNSKLEELDTSHEKDISMFSNSSLNIQRAGASMEAHLREQRDYIDAFIKGYLQRQKIKEGNWYNTFEEKDSEKARDFESYLERIQEIMKVFEEKLTNNKSYGLINRDFLPVGFNVTKQQDFTETFMKFSLVNKNSDERFNRPDINSIADISESSNLNDKGSEEKFQRNRLMFNEAKGMLEAASSLLDDQRAPASFTNEEIRTLLLAYLTMHDAERDSKSITSLAK